MIRCFVAKFLQVRRLVSNSSFFFVGWFCFHGLYPFFDVVVLFGRLNKLLLTESYVDFKLPWFLYHIAFGKSVKLLAKTQHAEHGDPLSSILTRYFL